jgi:hypothetical protein
MKASDKVISILFVTIFGYLILSHLVLRAKWNRTNFAETGSTGYSLYDQHELPEFKYLKLIGLSDCRLIPSLKARLDVEKGMFHFVNYHLNEDTLIVDGSLSPDKRSSFSNGQTPQKVKIFLPPINRIEALNSILDVRGESNLQNSRKFDFLLDASRLNTRARFDVDSLPRYFDNFSVRAMNHSEVFLFRKDHFNAVEIELANSNFYGRNAKAERFSVRADSSSMVVSGGNDFQLIITQ